MQITTVNTESIAGMNLTVLAANGFGLLHSNRLEARQVAAAKALAPAALPATFCENGPRLELVAKLRRLIASGTYCVSASDLAEKMMGRMWRLNSAEEACCARG